MSEATARLQRRPDAHRFVLRFDGAGRCRELVEYYVHRRKDGATG